MILQLVTSFIAAAAFCILFNAPARALLQCGIAGMVGWVLYLELETQLDTVVATFLATVVVGVISQLFARSYKMPVIIFSVGGIIPMVPGGWLMMPCVILLRMTIIRRFNTVCRRCCYPGQLQQALCSARCWVKCSAGKSLAAPV